MGFVDEVQAPVPVSDAWADWLAHADALTAAGDPRGEAIRLEHLGVAGDGAELAAAYGRVERACGLEGLRADGSRQLGWSRGLLDTAVFRLAEGTGPLPRLESLAVRELVIEDNDEDRDPLEVLTGLAPRFAHLTLRVEGDIEVEGADDQEVERLLAGLGPGREADADDAE